jgi:hypothetical protein
MNSAPTFSQLVSNILGLANTLVPLLIGLAMLAFFVGLIRYVYDSGSSDAHKNGRQLIAWGLIALFVLVCVWGIVNFISLALLGQAAPGV